MGLQPQLPLYNVVCSTEENHNLWDVTKGLGNNLFLMRNDSSIFTSTTYEGCDKPDMC